MLTNAADTCGDLREKVTKLEHDLEELKTAFGNFLSFVSLKGCIITHTSLNIEATILNLAIEIRRNSRLVKGQSMCGGN